MLRRKKGCMNDYEVTTIAQGSSYCIKNVHAKKDTAQK